MILNVSHHIVRSWIDANLDTYVASLKHRENLDPTPVLTPTGKIKVKSTVFGMRIHVTTSTEPKLCHEILDWLHEQEFDGQWCIHMEFNRWVSVAFANKKDAAQFKLIWDEQISSEYTQ